MRDESRQPSEPGFLKGVPHMEPGFLKGVPHRCRLKCGRVPTMLAQKGKTVLAYLKKGNKHTWIKFINIISSNFKY